MIINIKGYIYNEQVLSVKVDIESELGVTEDEWDWMTTDEKEEKAREYLDERLEIGVVE